MTALLDKKPTEDTNQPFSAATAYYGLISFMYPDSWLRHYTTRWKVVSRPDEVNFFSIYLILPTTLGPGVYSASNRKINRNLIDNTP
jgi:hypothetical protein